MMKLPQKVVRPVTLFSMGAFVVLAAAPAVVGEMGLCGSCGTGSSVAMAATTDGDCDKDKGECSAVAATAGLASLAAQGQCTAGAATQAAACCDKGDKDDCDSGATAATASLASLESAASCGDKSDCGDKDDCEATASAASLASAEPTCCSAIEEAAAGDLVASAN